jgi:hypothetical protein
MVEKTNIANVPTSRGRGKEERGGEERRKRREGKHQWGGL